MLRYLFAFILLIHGLIHFMGFSKAFGFAAMKQLSIPISRLAGTIWLITGLLLIVTIILFLIKNNYWWIAAIISVIFSQVLIIGVWNDAKYGTIANFLILIVAIISNGSWNFENKFKQDVNDNLKNTNEIENSLVTEKDLEHLPGLVQKYLRYTGVLNKPKVKNVRIEFHGEMRDKGKSWFPFTSEQYNFFDSPTRLFFMKGNMYGITVPVYHAYQKNTSSMQIKLFGLFPVVNIKSQLLFQAETVTIFNDMCLMAPATLIDKRIQWQEIDSSSVRAFFTNNGTKISAILLFNKKGELINFISDDRIAVADMKNYRFSTPISTYKKINGFMLGTYGEAIWHYPDGNFTYGKFNLTNVEYNVSN